MIHHLIWVLPLKYLNIPDVVIGDADVVRHEMALAKCINYLI